MKLGLITCAIAGVVLTACQVPSDTSPQAGDAATASTSTKLVGKSLLDAAREAERQGDYVTAGRYYTSVYNRDQDNATALVGMSRSLRNQNRAAEAEAVLARALSQADRDPELLSEMGKVQVALGKPLDAIESLSKAISLGATRWDIETALAVGYDRIGMYDKAERHYENALTQNPGNAVVFNNFGLSRAQAGDLDGAVGLLEKAVALPESTPRMRQNLALLYAIRGDLLAAEALVSRDLSGADAEANMAYYRRLRQSVSQDGRPPRLPDLGSNIAAGPNVGAVVGDASPTADGEDVRMAAVPQQPVEAAPVRPLKDPSADAEAKPRKTAQTDSDPWNKVASPPATEPAAPSTDEAARKPAPTPPATAASADTEPHRLRPGTRTPAVSAATDEKPTPPPADAAPSESKPSPAAMVRVPATPAKQPAEPRETPAPATATKPSPAAAVRPGEQATRSVPAVDNDPAGRFAIQVGSYREQSRAQHRIDAIGPSQADLLRRLDLSVVAAEVAGKGTYYRAMIGRIADYGDAQRLCEELKTRDISCLVVQAK